MLNANQLLPYAILIAEPNFGIEEIDLNKLMLRLQEDNLIYRYVDIEPIRPSSSMEEEIYSKLYTTSFLNLNKRLNLTEKFNLKISSNKTDLKLKPYLNNLEIYITEESIKAIYDYSPISLESQIDKAILVLYYYLIMGYEETDNDVLHLSPLTFLIYSGSNLIIDYIIKFISELYIDIPIYNLDSQQDRNKLNLYITGEKNIDYLQTS